MTLDTRPALTLALLGALSGCTAQDADLAATPALVDLSLNASTDQLAQRKTEVTGVVELGYTDERMVDITVFDNGTPVFRTSSSAEKGTIPYAATVDLLWPDVNALTATATYQDQSISTSAAIAVPGALQDFTATPVATDVQVMEVEVDVAGTLGFVSTEAAELVLSVGGDVVVARSLDASSTSVSTSETLTLPGVGTHAIDARLTYEGNVLSDSFVVSATAPAPSVTLPVWTTALTPGVEMLATGELTVVPDAPWETQAVRVSTDGGMTWTAAAAASGPAWSVVIENPDINGQPVLYEIDTVHRGVVHTTTVSDDLQVDPVFDCQSPLSMLPTTELIEDHNTEVRTMVGYFGDPAAGHTVSFIIDVSVPNDGLYEVVGALMNYGTFAIETEFTTDRLRCGGDCTIDYDLEVFVDGQLLCAETNYGVIREY